MPSFEKPLKTDYNTSLEYYDVTFCPRRVEFLESDELISSEILPFGNISSSISGNRRRPKDFNERFFNEPFGYI